MDPSSRSVLNGTLFGFVGVIAAVLVAFGRSMLSMPYELWMLIPVGLLTAIMLAMVRAGWIRRAMMLAFAVAPIRYLITNSETVSASSDRLISWIPVTSARVAEFVGDIVGGLVLGFSVFAVAIFFNEMDRRGWKFGKFLLVGPMLGFLWVGLVPLEQIAQMAHSVSRQDLFYGFFHGVIVGDGVGLGAELYNMLSPPPTAPRSVPLTVPGTPPETAG